MSIKIKSYAIETIIFSNIYYECHSIDDIYI